jgi:DNA-binding phage protein
MAIFDSDRLWREFNLRGLGITDVARELGCTRETIYSALAGKRVSARISQGLLRLLQTVPKVEDAELLIVGR